MLCSLSFHPNIEQGSAAMKKVSLAIAVLVLLAACAPQATPIPPAVSEIEYTNEYLDYYAELNGAQAGEDNREISPGNWAGNTEVIDFLHAYEIARNAIGGDAGAIGGYYLSFSLEDVKMYYLIWLEGGEEPPAQITLERARSLSPSQVVGQAIITHMHRPEEDLEYELMEGELEEHPYLLMLLESESVWNVQFTCPSQPATMHTMIIRGELGKGILTESISFAEQEENERQNLEGFLYLLSVLYDDGELDGDTQELIYRMSALLEDENATLLELWEVRDAIEVQLEWWRWSEERPLLLGVYSIFHILAGF